MSETKEVSINVSFEANTSTYMALGATGAVLIAAILAAVTLGAGWGSFTVEMSGGNFGGQGFNNEGTYELFEISGTGSSTEYSSSSMDDADGIGLVRAAGPLAVVGVVLGFVAALVLAASVFVQGFHLRLIGGITVALTLVFLVLSLVLFPIGISDMHEAGTQTQGGFTFTVSEITWGAGLVLAIIGAVFVTGATTLGFLSLRKPTE